jgi:hypothetical protein
MFRICHYWMVGEQNCHNHPALTHDPSTTLRSTKGITAPLSTDPQHSQRRLPSSSPEDALSLFAAAPPIPAQRHLCVSVSIAAAPNACTCQGISIDYHTAASTLKRDFSAAPSVHDCYLPARLIEVFERASSCCIVDASAVVLIPAFQQHATRTAYAVTLLHLHLQHPCSVQPCSLFPKHLLCTCKL